MGTGAGKGVGDRAGKGVGDRAGVEYRGSGQRQEQG